MSIAVVKSSNSAFNRIAVIYGFIFQLSVAHPVSSTLYPNQSYAHANT
ncbi:MAG: hypothetical protein ACXWT8_15815 [Methylobacter sp.]